MVGILVAAALAAASPAAVPAGTDSAAAPAIFVVRDADTTVYLFGTFHALDGKARWFDDRVKAAFEQSDELVLETLIPETPAPGASQQPISNLSVTPSASFLASTRMAISAGRAQGMQVSSGADMVLRRAAEAEGKPVEGLETLQSQLDMFTRMPATLAAAPRRADGPAMDSLSKSMVEMQDAWKHGDQRVFVRMLGELERGSPDTYRVMFTERNARWADWIRARMQTPGTVFVAVGAGHLAGKDSVLVHLAQLGIRSERVY
jgi:uncharacterized protein YbaP (TraB family)